MNEQPRSGGKIIAHSVSREKGREKNPKPRQGRKNTDRRLLNIMKTDGNPFHEKFPNAPLQQP